MTILKCRCSLHHACVFMEALQNDALVYANHIMGQIAATLPHIAPITEHDVDLFNSFFALERNKGREAHSDSFSYFLQMMGRIGIPSQPKLGYRYFDGHNLIPIATHPLKEDPSKLGIFIVRPMGSSAIEQVVCLTKTLRTNNFTEPIFVKKIFPAEAAELYQHDFLSITAFPWHSTALREDDTYPEQLFDLQATHHTVPSKHNLTKTYKNCKRFLQEHRISETETDFATQAWDITQAFFKHNQKETNISTPNDYYNLIFHNPDRAGLVRKIVQVDDVPAAYYILDRAPGARYSNFYASIALRHLYKQLGDYVILSGFKNASSRYINMGGSEDSGIHQHKQKFGPTHEQQMEWVVHLC